MENRGSRLVCLGVAMKAEKEEEDEKEEEEVERAHRGKDLRSSCNRAHRRGGGAMGGVWIFKSVAWMRTCVCVCVFVCVCVRVGVCVCFFVSLCNWLCVVHFMFIVIFLEEDVRQWEGERKSARARDSQRGCFF